MFLTKIVAIITLSYGIVLLHLSLKSNHPSYPAGAVFTCIPALMVLMCMHYTNPKKRFEESLVFQLFCMDLTVAAIISGWEQLYVVACAFFLGIFIVSLAVFNNWLKLHRTSDTSTCTLIGRATGTFMENLFLVALLLAGFALVHGAFYRTHRNPILEELSVIVFSSALMTVIAKICLFRNRLEKYLMYGLLVSITVGTLADVPERPVIAHRAVWATFGCILFVFLCMLLRAFYEKRYVKTWTITTKPAARPKLVRSIDVESAKKDPASEPLNPPKGTAPSAPPLSVAGSYPCLNVVSGP